MTSKNSKKTKTDVNTPKVDVLNVDVSKDDKDKSKANFEFPIVVDKVYSYVYPHRLKDGSEVSYTHKYVRTLKKAKKTEYESWIEQELDRLATNFACASKLNSLMNNILHYKSYNERNMKKQLNKVRARGNLSKKTEELVKLTYKKSNSLANSIEKEILLLLEFMDDKDKEEKQLIKELKKLDKGDFDIK